MTAETQLSGPGCMSRKGHAFCWVILSWRPAGNDLEEEGVENGLSQRYKKFRAGAPGGYWGGGTSRTAVGVAWHPGGLSLVAFVMPPAAARPGRVSRARGRGWSRACLLLGSAQGRVAVPREPDLIYALCH